MKTFEFAIMAFAFMFTFGGSKAEAAQTVPKAKCPAGQYWDAPMKMCMPTAKTGDPATFASLEKTVFSVNCTSCHMVMGPKEPADAGIDLSSYKALTASNTNKKNPKHAPFIVAGDPEHSKLYVAINTGKMPKKEDGTPAPKLSAADIQNVYDWIKQGAINN